MKQKEEHELSPVQRRWKLFWHYMRPVTIWVASIAIVLVISHEISFAKAVLPGRFRTRRLHIC